MYHLIQTEHDQSSLNKLKKGETAVGIFCGGMKNEHLSSVEKKINELLTADDLVVTCESSFKKKHDQSSLKTFREFEAQHSFVEG